jgi:hypothetical protein
MRTARHAAVVLTLLPLIAPAAALAWGNAGHQVVCEIAFQRMGQDARALVRELRRADPEPSQTFFASCTWPDAVRNNTHQGTGEYHFVNVKDPASGLDLARDCEAKDCVTVAIRRYGVYLRDYALAGDDAKERLAKRAAEALKFLGHFVGDLHQPLHAGRAADRGGNDIEVVWEPTGQRRKLHGMWDTDIPSFGGIRGVSAAPGLLAELDETEAAAWMTQAPGAWLEESWVLARDVAYPSATDDLVSEDEIDAALPVVREQLLKAGVRLAHLLDLAAAGTLQLVE